MNDTKQYVLFWKWPGEAVGGVLPYVFNEFEKQVVELVLDNVQPLTNAAYPDTIRWVEVTSDMDKIEDSELSGNGGGDK